VSHKVVVECLLRLEPAPAIDTWHGYGYYLGLISQNKAEMNKIKLALSFTTISLLLLSGCSSDNHSSPDTDQTSTPTPDAVSGDREVLSDTGGDDTSAIAGLWNANSDEAERYVEISNAGQYKDYTLNESGSNCYFVTPMTINLELAATDSTPATFSTADGRSFTAEVIDMRLAFTLIADDSFVGAEVDTTTQNWIAVEGIIPSDLPVCTPEVPIEEPDGAPAPTLTSAQCAAQGGSVIGDIGDGAIYGPEYRCASGAAPIARIVYLEDDAIPTEGAVCCV